MAMLKVVAWYRPIALGNVLIPSNFTLEVYWIQLSLRIRQQIRKRLNILFFNNTESLVIAFTTASLCNSVKVVCLKHVLLYFQIIFGTSQISSNLSGLSIFLFFEGIQTFSGLF